LQNTVRIQELDYSSQHKRHKQVVTKLVKQQVLLINGNFWVLRKIFNSKWKTLFAQH